MEVWSEYHIETDLRLLCPQRIGPGLLKLVPRQSSLLKRMTCYHHLSIAHRTVSPVVEINGCCFLEIRTDWESVYPANQVHRHCSSKNLAWGAWLVQFVEYATLILGVTSSSPMLGIEFTQKQNRTKKLAGWVSIHKNGTLSGRGHSSPLNMALRFYPYRCSKMWCH